MALDAPPTWFRPPQVISRVEGGALEVRIPGEGGCTFWLLTLLLPSFPLSTCSHLHNPVHSLPARFSTPPVHHPSSLLPLSTLSPRPHRLWSQYHIIGARFRAAARCESILLSPHLFSITIKLPDRVTEQRGSTSRLQAVVVQDLNSPPPLPSPPMHGAGYRPVANPPNLVCVFVEQQQDYRFGTTLSDAEKYWVVGELSHHLHCMRLRPAQEHV
ncbi:unnamed protein product [Closterium sp. NIES-65]|nr:unnamed protein product [Closterium sp. NIES-65]CAI5970517.1 unnamed protein product [Closterium sp. NIES-65]